MEVDGCPFPDDCRYVVEEGVWLKEGPTGGEWTLGLVAPMVAFVGRILAVRYRSLPAGVTAGQSLATLESVRATGAIRLPVDGTITGRNDELADRPQLVNKAPYENGWIVRFRPTVPGALRAFPDGTGARAQLASFIRERHAHCYVAFPDAEMIEIGSECSAILARLDEELARRAPDDVVLLVSDDPTSPIEMVRWSDRTGQTVLEHRAEGGLHRFLVRKELHPTPRRRSPTTGVV
jgi:glycine cleavage system H protein